MATPATYAHIKLKYLVQGEMCYNNFFYLNDSVVTQPGYANALVTAWWNAVSTEFTDAWPTIVDIVEVNAQVGHNPALNYFESASIFPALNGSLAAEVMPQFVTATLLKLPDNTTLDPVGNEPFARPGRIPISGVPETGLTDGQFNAGYETLLNAIAAALMSFSYNSNVGATTMNLGMFRAKLPGETETTVAEVASVVIGRVGTQNTRKP